jgi:simple sugar transport system permease protein
VKRPTAAGAALMLADTGDEFTAMAWITRGGSMLTDGGLVAGTLIGGMIFGLIATLINFNGAWVMFVCGVLQFLFILLQRFLVGSFSLRSAA